VKKKEITCLLQFQDLLNRSQKLNSCYGVFGSLSCQLFPFKAFCFVSPDPQTAWKFDFFSGHLSQTELERHIEESIECGIFACSVNSRERLFFRQHGLHLEMKSLTVRRQLAGVFIGFTDEVLQKEQAELLSLALEMLAGTLQHIGDKAKWQEKVEDARIEMKKSRFALDDLLSGTSF